MYLILDTLILFRILSTVNLLSEFHNDVLPVPVGEVTLVEKAGRYQGLVGTKLLPFTKVVRLPQETRQGTFHILHNTSTSPHYTL